MYSISLPLPHLSLYMSEPHLLYCELLLHTLCYICSFCIARCRKWVINCRRQDLDKKKPDELHRNYFLCSEHFEVSQLFTNSSKKRLNWNATPTVFKVRMKQNVTAILYLNRVYYLHAYTRSRYCDESVHRLCVRLSICKITPEWVDGYRTNLVRMG